MNAPVARLQSFVLLTQYKTVIWFFTWSLAISANEHMGQDRAALRRMGKKHFGAMPMQCTSGYVCRCLGKSRYFSSRKASPARDGAAGTTSLPLCAQTGMTAVTSYSLIVPLSRITWEFISFSTIIQIGDIHDLSGFSY